MNELHLPPAPPLPAEVRERALRTVLAGTSTRRRAAPLVAVAAAVVTALALTTSVALTGIGSSIDSLDQPTGSPAPTQDALVDETLARCMQAVVTWNAPNDLPPATEWRVTEVLWRPGAGSHVETALAINDSFVCLAGPSVVTLSDVHGTPAGGAKVTWLTSAIIVVLNPRRLPVVIDGKAPSTAPVQLVEGGENAPASEHHLVVAGFDGPMPETDSGGFSVQDRQFPTDPEPASRPELETCLDKVMLFPRSESERVEDLLYHGSHSDIGAAIAGRVADRYAGFCYDDGSGGSGAEGELPADGATAASIVTSIRTEDDVVVALLATPPDVRRVEITTPPQGGRTGAGARCTLDAGLALCTLRTAGEAVAVTFDAEPGGTGTSLPVP